MVRAMRPFRSVVVFPIFGLAWLMPKLQILWWSLGRGIAVDVDVHHGDPMGDAFDEYARLG
jgi:hypothetical protein